MQNPYMILGLEYDADEATIRQRYLELVRQFPPEREPVRAAQIRRAYDELRDPVVRLTNQLFEQHSHQTFENLVDAYKPNIKGFRFPTHVLLSLGQI